MVMWADLAASDDECDTNTEDPDTDGWSLGINTEKAMRLLPVNYTDHMDEKTAVVMIPKVGMDKDGGKGSWFRPYANPGEDKANRLLPTAYETSFDPLLEGSAANFVCTIGDCKLEKTNAVLNLFEGSDMGIGKGSWIPPIASTSKDMMEESPAADMKGMSGDMDNDINIHKKLCTDTSDANNDDTMSDSDIMKEKGNYEVVSSKRTRRQRRGRPGCSDANEDTKIAWLMKNHNFVYSVAKAEVQKVRAIEAAICRLAEGYPP
jgi:hypothetical protein